MAFPENKGKPHFPSNLLPKLRAQVVLWAKFDVLQGIKLVQYFRDGYVLAKNPHLGGGVSLLKKYGANVKFRSCLPYNFWQICETTYSNL